MKIREQIEQECRKMVIEQMGVREANDDVANVAIPDIMRAPVGSTKKCQIYIFLDRSDK